MKVSTEKLKARGAQFQEEGVRVQKTLELNAGMKETNTSQENISKSLVPGVKSPPETRGKLGPVAPVDFVAQER
jgi:hypothetical protein